MRSRMLSNGLSAPSQLQCPQDSISARLGARWLIHEDDDLLFGRWVPGFTGHGVDSTTRAQIQLVQSNPLRRGSCQHQPQFRPTPLSPSVLQTAADALLAFSVVPTE